MSVCDDGSPTYKCGDPNTDFGSKTQAQSGDSSLFVTQNADRAFTLTAGKLTIPINKLDRVYSYTQQDSFVNSNGKVILIPDGFGVAYIDCYDHTETHNATISEDYTRTDVTFLYVDLRTDTLVYKESIQTMKFNMRQEERIPLQTAFDETYLYPFIKEDVPITITNKYICTDFTVPLHEEVIPSGYWDGLRILMPLFTGGDPRNGYFFTIDGVEYNAGEVDWYFLDAEQRRADGDSWFWWADWHKAVGINNQIDKQEAANIADVYDGVYTLPKTVSSLNGVIVDSFYGSVAHDKESNVFLSAEINTFDGSIVLVNKLVVNDTEEALTTEDVYARKMNGTDQAKDSDGNLLWEDKTTSEHTAWFPIAPI